MHCTLEMIATNGYFVVNKVPCFHLDFKELVACPLSFSAVADTSAFIEGLG